MKQSFIIKGRLAGYNDYISASHTPWKRSKLKEEQEGIVKDAAQNLKPMRSPVIVSITYYEGKTAPRQRVRDLDNVTGGGNKFILDALVSMGIIQNDNPENVPRLYVSGFKATGEPRIEVTLESEE